MSNNSHIRFLTRLYHSCRVSVILGIIVAFLDSLLILKIFSERIDTQIAISFSRSDYALFVIVSIFTYIILCLVVGFVGALWVSLVLRFVKLTISINSLIPLYWTLYTIVIYTILPMLFWNLHIQKNVPYTSGISLLGNGVIFLVAIVLGVIAGKISYIFQQSKNKLWLKPMRWITISTVLLLCVGITVFVLTPQIAQQKVATSVSLTPDEQYNLILITIDALRADHLGCYGYQRIKTPNIDKLADGGTRFLQAVTTVPITLPSHCSIMTGTYPIFHGVRDNGEYIVPDTLYCLAEILHDNGYSTAAFVSAFPLNIRFGLNQGFSIYDDTFIGTRAAFTKFLMYQTTLFNSFAELGIVKSFKIKFHRDAGETTDRMINWLTEHKNNRFFIWVHYFDPHCPYQPPSPYDEMYTQELENISLIKAQTTQGMPNIETVNYFKALYDGEISFVDSQIGRILATLSELNLTQSTMIIITADHGESFGHNVFFAHAKHLYDSVLRIPLIFYLPDVVPSNKVIHQQVQSIDILPTVLELFHISSHKPIQGQSLIPLIFDNNIFQPRDAYCETLHPVEEKNQLRAIRAFPWKYIYAPHGEIEELYHLVDDPHELVNLAEVQSSKARELKQRLIELIETNSSAQPLQPLPMDKQTQQALKSLGYIQ